MVDALDVLLDCGGPRHCVRLLLHPSNTLNLAWREGSPRLSSVTLHSSRVALYNFSDWGTWEGPMRAERVFESGCEGIQSQPTLAGQTSLVRATATVNETDLLG